ncbi:DUF1507 family protein [Loigolactobacillus coryniformis]|uniref:DUF1507 family protein n=1 Tax=Loigolactobacillus coryniformis TaxID=1610 RepID=A0A5B8TJE1_9LACO|nr:DUF1507 family protein [Loigolactobacillus coryniformis]RRG05978.1 MAG: DUF1507 family protein [Lactobacillus sp.]
MDNGPKLASIDVIHLAYSIKLVKEVAMMTDDQQAITADMVLQDDADKIEELVNKQRVSLCLSQCPAFEEVVDTQVFGYSKEVMLAVRLNLIPEEQGHNLVRDLEQRLNAIYADSFDKQKQK